MKAEIIEFLKDNRGSYRANELAKLFNTTSREINRLLLTAPEIEVKHAYGIDRFQAVRDTSVELKTRLKGEYKPDTAMRIAMDRCKESREGEFHAKTTCSTNACWTYFPV